MHHEHTDHGLALYFDDGDLATMKRVASKRLGMADGPAETLSAKSTRHLMGLLTSDDDAHGILLEDDMPSADTIIEAFDVAGPRLSDDERKQAAHDLGRYIHTEVAVYRSMQTLQDDLSNLV